MRATFLAGRRNKSRFRKRPASSIFLSVVFLVAAHTGSKMKGLWDLSTRTIDPGLGVAVFDALVAFLVTSSMVTLISRRSKLWPEARLLNIGMGLLSM